MINEFLFPDTKCAEKLYEIQLYQPLRMLIKII